MILFKLLLSGSGMDPMDKLVNVIICVNFRHLMFWAGSIFSNSVCTDLVHVMVVVSCQIL